MKKSKIIGTIWVLGLTLLIGTILMGTFGELEEYFDGNNNLSDVFSIGVIGSFFSFFSYGIVFWPPTLLLVLLVELLIILPSANLRQTRNIFIAEIIIIAIPLTYFAMEYDYPTWYYFIAVFAIGQLFRLRKLSKSKTKS